MVSRAALRASRALWRRRERYRQRKFQFYRDKSKRPRLEREQLERKWQLSYDQARAERIHRDRQIKAARPLHERALDEATKLIGIMEVGGNNVGEQVSALIREGGGIPGQAWCGWFQAVCYKRAGSKAVTWQWGSVRLYVPLAGISRTRNPEPGDPVRFTFDHIGMFVKDNGDGTIETIEGNTGASGAVSDSTTGGDGVYRKTRSKMLVRDYLRVSR